MILRPYQREASDRLVERLSLFDNALCVASTGAGKTVVLRDLVSRLSGRIVIAMSRTKLVEQNSRALGDVSVYSAALGEKDASGRVVVGSIQSLVKADIKSADYFIIDEAHNYSEQYAEFKTRLGARLIGFTATPYSSFGYIYGSGKAWDSVTYSIGLDDLIEQGYLVPPVLKSPPERLNIEGLTCVTGEYSASDVDRLSITSGAYAKQIKDALPRLSGRAKVIWSCASIFQATRVHLALSSYEASEIVHSGLSSEERVRALESFERGSARHLVFVTALSEGYDYPPIDAVVLLRPIRSPSLYVQIVGRGLRTYEGKQDCLVLDYGRVVETLGYVGAPLVSAVKRSSGLVSEYRFCPKCYEYVLKKWEICGGCGHVFAVEKIAAPTRVELTDTAYDGDVKGRVIRMPVDKVTVEMNYTAKSGNVFHIVKFGDKERKRGTQTFWFSVFKPSKLAVFHGIMRAIGAEGSGEYRGKVAFVEFKNTDNPRFPELISIDTLDIDAGEGTRNVDPGMVKHQPDLFMEGNK